MCPGLGKAVSQVQCLPASGQLSCTPGLHFFCQGMGQKRFQALKCSVNGGGLLKNHWVPWQLGDWRCHYLGWNLAWIFSIVEIRQPEIWGEGLVLDFFTVHPSRVSKHSPLDYLHFLSSASSHHYSGSPSPVEEGRTEKGLAARRGQFSVCSKGIPRHRT